MDMFNITQRIGYFRTKLNISARELSLRIGKHDSYINKLESKDFNLPAQVLLEIIDALNISEAEFFADNFTTYKEDNELANIIKTIPEKKRIHLINFLKNKN